MENKDQFGKANLQGKKDGKNATPSEVNTGGGVYVAGDVATNDGDFIGHDKTVYGDEIAHDKVGHDVYNVNAEQVVIYQYREETAPHHTSNSFVKSDGTVFDAAPIIGSDPKEKKSDVFLSYSRKDSDIMKRLSDILQAEGFTIWNDVARLEPGSPSWQTAIEKAIYNTKCMVVILSPEAKQSKWVEIEVSVAEEIGHRVFPVLANGDSFNAVLFRLRATQHADIREDWTAVRDQLVPALRRYIASITTESDFPTPLVNNLSELPASNESEQCQDVSKLSCLAKLDIPIEFDWVIIPAGEFLMGSDKKKDQRARDTEMPQHKVYLPDYLISRVPVTIAQFELFVKETNYKITPKQQISVDWPNSQWEESKRESQWSELQNVDQKAQHPVTCISWQDACAFCQWAKVRLPTEAEWEKAARGTDGRIWPWGNVPPDESRCNFNTNIQATTPVGKYPKGVSPFGVLDMVGNVWEWTSSIFKSYPYDANDGREDSKSKGDRTLRGGSFDFDIDFVRCAARSVDDAELGDDTVGFRVVFHLHSVLSE